MKRGRARCMTPAQAAAWWERSESLAFDCWRRTVRQARERARRGPLAEFDAAAGGALDPAHTALVFPCDRNGDLTDEGARQLAALLRALG